MECIEWKRWIVLGCILGLSVISLAHSKKKGEEKVERGDLHFFSEELLAELDTLKSLAQGPATPALPPSKPAEEEGTSAETPDEKVGAIEEEPIPEPEPIVDSSPAPSLDPSIRVIPKSSTMTTPLYVPPKDLTAPLPRLLDLPESIQESIPELKFMGHMYSTRPGKSSVIIKNKLYYEGEELAQGVLLEKVTEKGAILSYAGTRFQIDIWGSQFYQ